MASPQEQENTVKVCAPAAIRGLRYILLRSLLGIVYRQHCTLKTPAGVETPMSPPPSLLCFLFGAGGSKLAIYKREICMLQCLLIVEVCPLYLILEAFWCNVLEKAFWFEHLLSKRQKVLRHNELYNNLFGHI